MGLTGRIIGFHLFNFSYKKSFSTVIEKIFELEKGRLKIKLRCQDPLRLEFTFESRL